MLVEPSTGVGSVRSRDRLPKPGTGWSGSAGELSLAPYVPGSVCLGRASARMPPLRPAVRVGAAVGFVARLARHGATTTLALAGGRIEPSTVCRGMSLAVRRGRRAGKLGWMPSVDDLRARAARRAMWSGRVLRDGSQEEPGGRDLAAADLFVAAWIAAQAAAVFAGHATQCLPRAEWPGEVRRAG